MGLDHIEWQYEVEDEFEIQLPEAEVCAVRTPRQMADLVIRTKRLSPEPQQAHAVLERVMRLTADQVNLPLDKVKPDSDVFHDLGMG